MEIRVGSQRFEKQYSKNEGNVQLLYEIGERVRIQLPRSRSCNDLVLWRSLPPMWCVTLTEGEGTSVYSWQPVSESLLAACLVHWDGHITVIWRGTAESSHLGDLLHGDVSAVTGESRTGFKSVLGRFCSDVANDNALRLLTRCLFGLAVECANAMLSTRCDLISWT